MACEPSGNWVSASRQRFIVHKSMRTCPLNSISWTVTSMPTQLSASRRMLNVREVPRVRLKPDTTGMLAAVFEPTDEKEVVGRTALTTEKMAAFTPMPSAS